MSDLFQITQLVGEISRETKNCRESLMGIRFEINQLVQEVTQNIDGTTSQSYKSVISTFQLVQKKISSVISILSETEKVSQNWITQTYGGANASSVQNSINQIENSGHFVISLSSLPIINGLHNFSEDAQNSNPNFFQGYEWQNNCQRCVAVYEARRRGYNVSAAPYPGNADTLAIGTHKDGWPNIFENSVQLDCGGNSGTQAKQNILEYMNEWGDGTRAIIRVKFKGVDCGHVFIAEQINGKTVFVDPQTGNDNVEHYFDICFGNGVTCTRIDNLDFTDLFNKCFI